MTSKINDTFIEIKEIDEEWININTNSKLERILEKFKLEKLKEKELIQKKENIKEKELIQKKENIEEKLEINDFKSIIIPNKNDNKSTIISRINTDKKKFDNFKLNIFNLKFLINKINIGYTFTFVLVGYISFNIFSNYKNKIY